MLPHVIHADEAFSVVLESLVMPCRRCGADLRGKEAELIEPHVNEDGEQAWWIACAGGCG
jgi:hypothetical protein